MRFSSCGPTRRTDEEEPVHKRADCGDSEGVRSGTGYRRAVPQARHQPADVLSLKGEVRRAGGQRCAVAAATGRGEPQAEAAGGRTGAGVTGSMWWKRSW